MKNQQSNIVAGHSPPVLPQRPVRPHVLPRPAVAEDAVAEDEAADSGFASSIVI